MSATKPSRETAKGANLAENNIGHTHFKHTRTTVNDSSIEGQTLNIVYIEPREPEYVMPWCPTETGLMQYWFYLRQMWYADTGIMELHKN